MDGVEVNGYTIEPGANLGGGNLRGANLARVNLRGANLGGANLGGANLRGANLRGANLREADLREADLVGADFGVANLARANLTRANLIWANFVGADLGGADFGGANLTRANLGRANLRGANLSKARLVEARFLNAEADDQTIWAGVSPRGFKPVAARVKLDSAPPGVNSRREEIAEVDVSDSLSVSRWESAAEFDSRRKPERIFGHIPGVPVGTVFPDRRALSKSGVHRPTQAGISGNKTDGSDSIVVSGGYQDDQDLGDRIVYTGQGGNDPETKRQIADQELTRGNLALVISCDRSLPVRVVRGARGDPAQAPLSGYRYDGLFKVIKYWSESGIDGFLVWRFEIRQESETSDSELATSTDLLPVSVLGLSARPANVVKRLGITTVGELRGLTTEELLNAQNCGAGTVSEIHQALATFSSAPLPEGSRAGLPDVGSGSDLLPVSVLGLSARPANVVKRLGITTVGELRGLTTEELLNAPNCGAGSVSEIHQALAKLGLGGLVSDTGADEYDEPITVSGQIDRFLKTSDQRELDVWFARQMQWRGAGGTRPTLEELGIRLGVTRERVRQIEEKTRLKSSALKSNPEFRSLIEEVRRRVGPVWSGTSWGDARRVALEVAATMQPNQEWDDGSENAYQRLNVVLAAAGPYTLLIDSFDEELDESTVGTLWDESFRKKTLPDLKARVKEICRAETTISPDALSELIAPYGLLPEATDWIATEHFALQAIGSPGYAPTTVALSPLIEVVLRRVGEPMTAGEIRDFLQVERSVRYIGNALAGGEAFVRTGLKHYGLREWNLETYEGIAEEIAQRIERDGGSTSINPLLSELSATFGVSKNSVSMYTQIPRFVISDGELRLRRPDEFEPVEPDLSTRQGWWWLDERTVRYRLLVNRDCLRGSGQGIGPREAAALGVQYDGSATYLDDSGEAVEVRWRPTQIGPGLGAVRMIIEPLGLSKGDSLFLDFDIESRTVRTLPSVLGDSTLNGLIKELAGVEISESADHLQVLADLLGVDRKIEVVLGALYARKEMEMAGQVQILGDPPTWPGRGAIFQRIRDVVNDSADLSVLLTEEEDPVSLAVSVGNPTMGEFAMHCFTLGFTGRKSGTDSRGLRIYSPGLSAGEKTLLPSPSGLAPILVGYEPSLDVFVLWDTPVHLAAGGFTQMELLQVAEGPLYGATAKGVREIPIPKSKTVDRHKIVVCRASSLAEGLVRRKAANIERLLNEV